MNLGTSLEQPAVGSSAGASCFAPRAIRPNFTPAEAAFLAKPLRPCWAAHFAAVGDAKSPFASSGPGLVLLADDSRWLRPRPRPRRGRGGVTERLAQLAECPTRLRVAARLLALERGGHGAPIFARQAQDRIGTVAGAARFEVRAAGIEGRLRRHLREARPRRSRP